MALRDESVGDSVPFLILGEILPDVVELILKIPHFIIIHPHNKGINLAEVA